jgi:hypothetical protein
MKFFFRPPFSPVYGANATSWHLRHNTAISTEYTCNGETRLSSNARPNSVRFLAIVEHFGLLKLQFSQGDARRAVVGRNLSDRLGGISNGYRGREGQTYDNCEKHCEIVYSFHVILHFPNA